MYVVSTSYEETLSFRRYKFVVAALCFSISVSLHKLKAMGTEAESGHSVHFSLSESVPPSASFSRSQSPFPPEGKKAHDVWRRKTSSDLNEVLRPQRDDVYDRTLPWWRAAVRRKLVASIKEESRIIAKMQVSTGWGIIASDGSQLLPP